MKAMFNRCNPHFDKGILPLCRKTHNILCMIKTSLFVGISLLILLPATSLAVAPKYETAYACEGKTLTIECEQGDLINLIRANYGRFSITICNDHGNVEWSVNCMSPKSLRVLHSKCTHKQNCSVLASTNMFGDPCPGTHKYLEAHYQCISAAQTSTTTNRPSPPWLLTSTPSTSIGISDNGLAIAVPGLGGGTSVSTNVLGRLPTTSPKGGSNTNYHHDLTSIHYHNKPPPPPLSPTSTNSGGGEIHLAGGRPPIIGNDNSNTTATSSSTVKVASKVHRPIGVLPRPSSNGQDPKNYNALNIVGNSSVLMSSNGINNVTLVQPTQISPAVIKNNTAITDDSNSNKQHANIDNSIIYNNNNNTNGVGLDTTQSSVLGNSNINQNHHNQDNSNSNNQYNSNTNNIIRNNYNGMNGVGDNNFYCGPTTARNLFWNVTRVGEVNVQPCPGGATGIAKWRCVLLPRSLLESNLRQNDVFPNSDNNRNLSDSTSSGIVSTSNNCEKGSLVSNCDINKLKNYQPTWHPMTPDLTQCRSLWLNSLEIGVNQRDSSLISIANDLSQVTSSKILYGGDMLVTTKIIQTMSEKMSYDVETFPDQRQREAIIFELLHGVVKTGSNLLDESQHLSWLDLSFEDQMRVATSLLTGLEDNAFLLADTIIRERNVMQKVKNILLSVRVLETKNIVANEIFPDGKLEQWSVSDDRIELPRGALIENSEGGLVRIVFVAFDRLESILKPSYDNLDLKFSRNHVQNNVMNDTFGLKRIQILNSKVISASLGKGRHIQLSQPIKLILRHLKTENVSSPTCVYWNYIDHAWSADGCYLESTNRTHSICMCNHLTNFAILMDVIDERSSSLLSIIDSNMRILIYISIAICIIFIVIAILTLKLLNGVFIKVRRDNHNNNNNNIRRNINTTTTAITANNNHNGRNNNNNINYLNQQNNINDNNHRRRHFMNQLLPQHNNIENNIIMSTNVNLNHSNFRSIGNATTTTTTTTTHHSTNFGNNSGSSGVGVGVGSSAGVVGVGVGFIGNSRHNSSNSTDVGGNSVLQMVATQNNIFALPTITVGSTGVGGVGVGGGIVGVGNVGSLNSNRHHNSNNINLCTSNNFVNFKNTNINSIVFATSTIDPITAAAAAANAVAAAAVASNFNNSNALGHHSTQTIKQNLSSFE